MCGIFGYVGSRNAFAIGLRGIKDLEYRGYDSVGMALEIAAGEIVVVKTVGKVENLYGKLADREWRGRTSLWHTRWATHGEPSERNAHPHGDCRNQIWVAHNGIIENHVELKAWLARRGHRFLSETDTEVLPHLLEEHYRGDLAQALREALTATRGTYGVVVMDAREPQRLVAARMASPLVIGVGRNERLVASDATAILPHTSEVLHLDDGDIAVLTPNRHEITDISAKLIPRHTETLEGTAEEISRGGYLHYMLKEIFEQPEAIENSLRGRILAAEGNVRLGGLAPVAERLRAVEQLTIVACGTAYHAALVGRFLIEEIAGIQVTAELASEFVNRRKVLQPTAVVIAISQSGETMDTLLAAREAKAQGALTLGIVNRVGSLVARTTDAGVYNHIGPEMAVASTKAFISQLAVLVLLAVSLARQRGMSPAAARGIVESLADTPQLVREALKLNDALRALAGQYREATNFLYLGRGYQYPIALEGALKLKEISYVHAEGYSGGEMKHGPIALIDERFPTMALALSDSSEKKMLSNIEEIRSRRGPVIAVVDRSESPAHRIATSTIEIPPTPEFLAPIVSVVPLQLFAYYMGVQRGCDVDRPRNLAKSVTTE